MKVREARPPPEHSAKMAKSGIMRAESCRREARARTNSARHAASDYLTTCVNHNNWATACSCIFKLHAKVLPSHLRQTSRHDAALISHTTAHPTKFTHTRTHTHTHAHTHTRKHTHTHTHAGARAHTHAHTHTQ